VTGSIGSSFRQYFDWNSNSPRPEITVPAAVHPQHRAVHGQLPTRDRGTRVLEHSALERTRPGRVFMPLEEPDLLAAELRDFFGPLRGR
jgi:hypothetical protein